MGLNAYQEDLFVRYNHILNQRVTFKQKTNFIRSLMMEFKAFDSDIKVVEIREKGKKTSLSRNVYVGDVKNADVIVATYYDSPLVHLGPYYMLDKKKQRDATLLFNTLVSLALLAVGVLFTFFVTNKYFVTGAEHIHWPTFVLFGVAYMVLVYLISLFSKGIGRKRNVIRNNATLVYMINKIITGKKMKKKVAFAFLDSGTTNERGLYGLTESARSDAKIIYLDAIAASEKLYYMSDSIVHEFAPNTTFKKGGVYRVFAAAKNGEQYYLTKEQLNTREETTDNIDSIDAVIEILTK